MELVVDNTIINTGILDLPHELVSLIFSNLNEQELTVVSLVSKYFKDLAAGDILWDRFCINRKIEVNPDNIESKKAMVIKRVNKYILTFGPLHQRLIFRTKIEEKIRIFREANEDVTENNKNFIFYMNLEESFKKSDIKEKCKYLLCMIPKNIFEAEAFLADSIKNQTQPRHVLDYFIREEILAKENLNDVERVTMLIEAVFDHIDLLNQATWLGAPTEVLDLIEQSLK